MMPSIASRKSSTGWRWPAESERPIRRPRGDVPARRAAVRRLAEPVAVYWPPPDIAAVA
jgi:hypothetical protein